MNLRGDVGHIGPNPFKQLSLPDDTTAVSAAKMKRKVITIQSFSPTIQSPEHYSMYWQWLWNKWEDRSSLMSKPSNSCLKKDPKAATLKLAEDGKEIWFTSSYSCLHSLIPFFAPFLWRFGPMAFPIIYLHCPNRSLFTQESARWFG